jgi:hypothetical protein
MITVACATALQVAPHLDLSERSEAGGPIDRPLNCSVLAPTSVGWGQAFLLHVYVHPPDTPEAPSTKVVVSLAAQIEPELPEALRRSAATHVVRTLDAPVERQSVIVVTIDRDGLLSGASESGYLELSWKGTPTGVEMALRAPWFALRRAHHPTLRFWADGKPIGRVRLRIRRHLLWARSTSIRAELKAYRRAFLSYSSDDRIEVLKRAEVLMAAKLDVFQDVLKLRAGQQWRREIYREIDGCDLFLLFWSRAAKMSEWVEREAKYALRRRSRTRDGVPDIVPINLETVEPPSYLRHIQFGDPVFNLLAQGHDREARPPHAPP